MRFEDTELSAWFDKLLKGGIALTLIYAWAYLGTYCYEVGYLGFFSVPTNLVEIDQSIVVRNFLIVALGVCITIAAIDMFGISAKFNLESIRSHFLKFRLFGYLIIFLLYVFPSLLVYRATPDKSATWISTFIFFVVASEVLWLVDKKNMHASLQRKNRILDFLGRKIVIGVVVFFLSLGIFRFGGQVEASFKRNYLVINGPQQWVIIRTYPTKSIAMSKDPNQKKLDPTIRLLTSSDLASQKTEMVIRHIGSFMTTTDR